MMFQVHLKMVNVFDGLNIQQTAYAWLTEFHQKVKGRIAIAFELNKGPRGICSSKIPLITVFPVHALSLARYRQASAQRR
jgi:hypothetical protein